MSDILAGQGCLSAQGISHPRHSCLDRESHRYPDLLKSGSLARADQDKKGQYLRAFGIGVVATPR